MRVFAINLDRDTTRLRRFRSVMEYLHVPFERWPATAGDELDVQKFGVTQLEPGVFVSEFLDWSCNEAACGVSHIRALRHIVDQALPWAIIMEDDGVLKETIPLDDEEWELPADADIVLLNERATLGIQRHRGCRFSYGDVVGGAGTEGYLVSLQGAEKLLRVLNPLRNPLDFQMYAHFESIQAIDRPPYHWRVPRNRHADVALKAYRIEPSLVMHSSDRSSIGNSRHPRARYYCKVLLALDFDDDGQPDRSAVYPSLGGAGTSPRAPAGVASPLAADTLYWRGADISQVDECMRFRATPDAQPTRLMAVLRDSGVNIIRLSVWVDRDAPLNADRALRLAREAAGHGLQVCLVLHYSDTWADPRQQRKPTSWSHLSTTELGRQVYTYTRDIVAAMGTQGTLPAIVQTGNEISNGMLWADAAEPTCWGGRLFPTDGGDVGQSEGQWEIFAALLREAVRGVRDAASDGEEQPRVMLHLDRGLAPGRVAGWLEKVRDAGVGFDAIGLSFYAFWHGRAILANLWNIGEVSSYFPDKELVVAETAHPYRPFRHDGRSYESGDPPFTPEGQREYLENALRILRRLPNATGLFWWGAAFVNDRFGHCPDCFRAQALFDRSAVALPALTSFKAL